MQTKLETGNLKNVFPEKKNEMFEHTFTDWIQMVEKSIVTGPVNLLLWFRLFYYICGVVDDHTSILRYGKSQNAGCERP